MKRGDRTTIKIDDKRMEAEYLGRGHYARAYRVADEVFLYVKGCFMKEAIEDIEAPHVPKVTYVGDDERSRGDDLTRIYKMPYYESLTPRHREAWTQYRELERSMEEARSELRDRYGPDFRLDVYGYETAMRCIDGANVPESLKEGLRTMIDAGANYGSGVTFEFAKRNLGVDASGSLILRDIMFDAEAVRRERELQMKRNRDRQFGLSAAW